MADPKPLFIRAVATTRPPARPPRPQRKVFHYSYGEGDEQDDAITIETLAKSVKELQEQRKEDHTLIRILESELALTKTRVPAAPWLLNNPTAKNDSSESKHELGNQIAHNITSVVGLKEAITWKYKGLKWVWAATLIIGIIATVWFVYASTAEYYAEPTATKVELEKQSEYAYPPVIICPEAWLDVDKASSLGLTIDALKYSLGYFDEFDELFRESNSTGKETFLEVYKKENFSSLDAYYKAIGIDIPGAKTMEEFAASDRTISICPSCVGQCPEKVFWNNGVCYVFQLAPEPADYSLKSLKNQIILMKMADHTDGLIRSTSIWPVYAPRSLTLRYATGSMLILPTFTGNIIRAESQRFVRLDTREAPCVKKDKVDANYSSEACFVECLEEAYDRVFKCRLFLQTTSTSKALSPTDYCNFYDSFPMSFWERVEYIRLQHKAIAESSDGSKCMSKCPKPCDQTVYELSLRFQVNEANAPEPQKEAQDYDRSRNLTFFALQLEHEALYKGGVLTLTEVSTISFTSLVSNLGGALGLFVGGTMMTFIQVILFVVKYVLDRRPII